jgi:hypothetical protein
MWCGSFFAIKVLIPTVSLLKILVVSLATKRNKQGLKRFNLCGGQLHCFPKASMKRSRSRSPVGRRGDTRSGAHIEILKERSRHQLEVASARHVDKAKIAGVSVSNPRPSFEVLQAINNERMVTFGEEYKKSQPVMHASHRGSSGRSEASLALSASAGGHPLHQSADEALRMNLKVGDRVVVRGAAAAGRTPLRGRVTAVLHRGYASARYDILVTSKSGIQSGDKINALWRDVTLDEPEVTGPIGRDRDSEGGRGDSSGSSSAGVDAFGRKIQGDRARAHRAPPREKSPEKYVENEPTCKYESAGSNEKKKRPDILGDYDAKWDILPPNLNNNNTDNNKPPTGDNEYNSCSSQRDTDLPASSSSSRSSSKDNTNYSIPPPAVDAADTIFFSNSVTLDKKTGGWRNKKSS